MRFESNEVLTGLPGVARHLAKLHDKVPLTISDYDGLPDVRLALRSDGLTKLARYETTIDRALHRALWQLAAIQACRSRGATDPPADAKGLVDDQIARRPADRAVVREAGARDRSVR